MPFFDALSLTLCINDFDVHRVLVDFSSATDLLQLPAFKQMKLSLGVLNSTGRILFGFNGATTLTQRDVALLIKVIIVVWKVLFSIVEDLGPYNSIMGRAWLNLMKVIPLTYHQMVRYLTNVWQVDILSSQLDERQCYQLYVREHRGKQLGASA